MYFLTDRYLFSFDIDEALIERHSVLSFIEVSYDGIIDM